MEDYVATDQRPLDKVLKDVANCDIYVGIFAWRYGYIPDKDNPHRRSITELEYRKASQRGKLCLIFLLDENTPWPNSLRDKNSGEGEGGRCIAELRQELGRDKIVSFFQTSDGLALEVILAVAQTELSWRIIDVPGDPDRRNLLKLLNRVKQDWIEGKLKGALYNEVLIPPRILRIVTQEETVDPWEPESEVRDQNSRILPKAEKIGEIFDNASQSLLILGEPGSGKTITLLELARDLMARAGLDPREPIPVVFNLSSWTGNPQSLVDWLIAELHSKYQIPKKIGRPWLQNYRILPLLDGLDEVKQDNRASCAKAIKEFSQEEAFFTGLAVCSRRAEYEALPSRPKLNRAIRLLPLKPEQIERYLESAGKKLEALRAALQTNNGLQSLAQSPLMLSVMCRVYEDEEEVETPDRRQHLFDTYINRMLGKTGAYTKDQTIDWLSRLARKMIQHSQSRFLIEELQPSWLSTDRQLWYYTLCCRLIAGLFFGLSVGLIRLWFAGPSYRTLIYFIGCGAFGALVMPILVRVKSFVDVRRILMAPSSIRMSEQLRWRWKDIRRAAVGGLKIGIVLGIVLGLVAEIAAIIQGRLSPRQAGYHFISDIILWSIQFTVLGGLLWGVSSDISSKKSKPNQGISLSLKNAFIMGTGSAVIFGVAAFMDLAKPWTSIPSSVFGDQELLSKLGRYGYGLYGGVISGIFFGQIIAKIYGGYSVVMHYVLRFFLYCTGQAPFRYAKFLNYAGDRILLHKVGGSYEFIHGLLLAHFALKSLSREIEKQPERTDLYEERATISFGAGDYQRAISDLDRVLEAEPHNEVVYLSRAACYRQLENHKAAISDVTSAINQRPDYLPYYRIRAQWYEEIGEAEKALADLTSIVQKQPADSGVRHERGRFHRRFGNNKLALDDLNKAIELLEDDLWRIVQLPSQGIAIRDLYYERGKTHYDLKNFTRALMDLDKAVELQSENSQNYYQRAIIHYTIADLESALSDLSEAIKRRPDYYSFYEWRGGFLEFRGEYEAAQADLDKALELEPQSSNSYFWQSLVFLNKGDVAGALTDLNKGIDLNPSAWRFPFWCGVAYQLQGDLQTAQSHWTHTTSLAQAESDVVEQRRGLAQVELMNGDTKTTRSHYLQALEGSSSEHHRLRTTLHYLEALCRLFPDREDIRAVKRWFADCLEKYLSDGR